MDIFGLLSVENLKLSIVGVIALVIGVFFRSIKFKTKNIDIEATTNASQPILPKIEDNSEALKNITALILDEIISDAYSIGFVSSEILHEDLPKIRNKMIKEKLRSFSIKIIETLVPIFTRSEDQLKIIEIYVEKFIRNLYENLEKLVPDDISRSKTVLDLTDKIKSRTTAILEEWRLIFRAVPEKLIGTHQKILLGLLDNSRYLLDDKFKEMIKSIYLEAHSLKTKAQMKIDEENQKMSEKVKNIRAACAKRPTIKKKSRRK